ncbi:CPBP family intramembrane glutamic endopeptidase [Actinomycetospora cinnamomea]|uniref:Membrane protease YdiL (CAAX protease family) n=1 Tax=Actinomycetospora cinnamomea TaxID=663609 RepID=A0A2U1F623_9PSEU|nr:CPBP family intramembrane glutamic endopeptidase [Actinomycetospora cinnamomea]PVZ07633.1 membrane protease YdiL (CAAX protease family) [Actinomycetospora cinnamomea]
MTAPHTVTTSRPGGEDTAEARPTHWQRLAPPLVVAVVLLVWSNLVLPALPADAVLKALFNVGGVAAMITVARLLGVTWADLGIGRGTWAAGLRWGGAAIGVAVLGYGAVLAVAPELLENPQLAGASPGSLLLRGLVLIPLGTVLAEELAFRGVLHGHSARALPVRAALGVSAVAFGLWHLSVALGPSAVPLPPALHWTSVLLVLAVTVVGGLALGWLRHRTGSVLAPIGLHLGTNAVGLVAAGVALAH